MSNEILILGSGTSTGIPQIACKCHVCLSADPNDKRLRTSSILKTKGKFFQIDTGPDFRQQMLNNQISKIDHVFITHDHADHLHGIDDLRPFCFMQNQTIPVTCNMDNFQNIRDRFPYIFKTNEVFNEKKPVLGGGIPRLELKPLELSISKVIQQTFLEEEFHLFNLSHGHSKTMGICHGKMAYIVDCHAISNEIVAFLKKRKLDILIIDCLKHADHQTHLNAKRAFRYILEISPKKAGLIHMAHQHSHQEWVSFAKKELGEHVFPVFDGMTLEYGE
ncbi:MAG: MBL fold metallo-hydrolase [Halobacteriovoraceae bacterium]|nr:MBL fold metallo-hydrolase [Halobacteriovoraceae bacterium]